MKSTNTVHLVLKINQKAEYFKVMPSTKSQCKKCHKSKLEKIESIPFT